MTDSVVKSGRLPVERVGLPDFSVHQPIHNAMKTNPSQLLPLLLLLTMTVGLNACVSAGGLFNSGIWIGVVLALLGVGLVFWIISKFNGGGRGNGSAVQ
jgi:hypothetical protein